MHMLFDPGQQYSYSGEGYFLTQRLVEQITEKDLNELLMEYFLRPLHMDIASATWTPEIGRRFSLGFGVDGKVVKIRDKRRTTGNAPEPCAAWSLYGNSFEMIRFLQYMIRDHGGLEERWFTELRRPQIAAGTGISWGLGWGLCSADPTVLWHWGDNDGFKSISLLDWDSGDGISIYTNSDNGFAFWAQVCAELTDAVFMDELVEFGPPCGGISTEIRMKTLGIIGGMGPLAGCDLLEKIIANTDARCDQDHIHVLLDSNTAIPDRTAAIPCRRG